MKMSVYTYDRYLRYLERLNEALNAISTIMAVNGDNYLMLQNHVDTILELYTETAGMLKDCMVNKNG